jgi:hypothetical protein
MSIAWFVASWQTAWRAEPIAVGLVASLVLLAMLTRRARPRVNVARAAAVVLLVIMLTGFRWQDDGATIRPPPNTDSGPRLIDVVAADVALVGDTVLIDVTATSGGASTCAGARKLPAVELVVNQTVLTEGQLHLSGERTAAGEAVWNTQLSWTPREAGVHRLNVRLKAMESGHSEQRMLTAVCGVAEAPLRVLLIDGLARWETRHLKRLLDVAPLFTADQVLLELESAAALPSKKQELSRYDAVVLGVFDPRDLPATTAAVIVEAAEQDGLGLVWALDGRADLAGMAASPLAPLLPCESRGPVLLPPAAQGYRGLATPAADGVPWIGPLLKAIATSQAEVYLPLAVRQRHGTAAAPLMLTSAPQADMLPGLLVDHTRAGRVVAMLTETWRWRASGASDEIDSFWQSAIRFVAEPRLQARLGRPLAAARRAAEETQREHRIASGGADVAAAAARVSHWTRFGWNHPLLVAMVMLLILCGWWWAETDPDAGRSRATREQEPVGCDQ